MFSFTSDPASVMRYVWFPEWNDFGKGLWESEDWEEETSWGAGQESGGDP